MMKRRRGRRARLVAVAIAVFIVVAIVVIVTALVIVTARIVVTILIIVTVFIVVTVGTGIVATVAVAAGAVATRIIATSIITTRAIATRVTIFVASRRTTLEAAVAAAERQSVSLAARCRDANREVDGHLALERLRTVDRPARQEEGVAWGRDDALTVKRVVSHLGVAVARAFVEFGGQHRLLRRPLRCAGCCRQRQIWVAVVVRGAVEPLFPAEQLQHDNLSDIGVIFERGRAAV